MKRGENKGDGIFKTKNGYGYRITKKKKGIVIIDTTVTLNENREPFITKAEAKTAKAAHLLRIQEDMVAEENGEQKKKHKITFAEAWEIYFSSEAKGKAESTVKKHASVWKNHIQKTFADKEMNNTTTTEMYTFLCDEYGRGLKYGYVESFLKVFYLLYGVALRSERISDEKYRKMFVNKETKLKMPPPNAEDEDDDKIIVYNSSEISKAAKICREEDNGDLYLVFLLCYYCGLRIGEACGLMWDDINYENNTISINKQLQPTDNQMFMICKLKTKNAKRCVDMPQVLRNELAHRHREYCKIKKDEAYKNTERILDRRRSNAPTITGGDFVNRRKNGALVTQNSIKKITNLIKKSGVSNFHFHALRSTHASQLAAANVPPSEVMKHLGHSKFDTTMKYYINTTHDAHKQLVAALNNINTDESQYLVSFNNGEEKVMSESTLDSFRKFVSKNPTSNAQVTAIKIVKKDGSGDGADA